MTYKIDQGTERAVDQVSDYLYAKDQHYTYHVDSSVDEEGVGEIETTVTSGLTMMSYHERRAIARDIVELVKSSQKL